MENEQLELFSLNYAESGNTNQLSSMPGEEPLVEKCNTDGCSIFLPAAGYRNNGSTSMNNVGSNGNYWSSIISRNYAALRIHKETIRQYLYNELGLTLHPKKSKIVKYCYGLDFLGVFVKPHRRYINNRAKKKIFRKSASFIYCTDADKLRAVINSYLGYMKYLKCGKIKERLFAAKPQLKLLGEFIGHYDKFCLLKPPTQPEAESDRAKTSEIK